MHEGSRPFSIMGPKATDEITEEETPGFYVKARYVLALMMTLGVINLFSLRNGINVAILAMVDTTTNASTSNYSYESECFVANETATETSTVGEFHWTVQQQSQVIACYYFGYMFMNIPGAYLAKRFGIRLVFGLSLLVSSFLTLLVPTVARRGVYLLMALRTLIGLLEGAIFPTIMTAWGIWAPPLERSRLTSISFSGFSMGNCLIFPVVGIIVSEINWEASFYITGSAGIIYSLCWFVLIRNSPSEHPRISTQERRYIEDSIGIKSSSEKNLVVPWKRVLTSPPVIGTFIAHLSDNWTTLCLTSLGPMYLARVQGFDIKSAGILSSLPFVLRVIITVLWGFVADALIASKFFSLLTVRKISSATPLLLSSISLVAVAYLGCSTYPVVLLLACAIGFLGMTCSGFICSYLELAPIYCGVIYSFVNTFNSAMGFIAPLVSALFLTDNSLNSWQKVFWLATSIAIIGIFAFTILGKANVQPWAMENGQKEEAEPEYKHELISTKEASSDIKNIQ